MRTDRSSWLTAIRGSRRRVVRAAFNFSFCTSNFFKIRIQKNSKKLLHRCTYNRTTCGLYCFGTFFGTCGTWELGSGVSGTVPAALAILPASHKLQRSQVPDQIPVSSNFYHRIRFDSTAQSNRFHPILSISILATCVRPCRHSKRKASTSVEGNESIWELITVFLQSTEKRISTRNPNGPSGGRHLIQDAAEEERKRRAPNV